MILITLTQGIFTNNKFLADMREGYGGYKGQESIVISRVLQQEARLNAPLL